MHGRALPGAIAGILLLCAELTEAATNPTRLFDGKTLEGWKVDDRARGRVAVEKGCIYMMMAKGKLSRIEWREDFPRTNYEVTLEVLWVDGSHDFCRIVFPVGSDHSRFGMQHSLLGLQLSDGPDIYENTTKQRVKFKQKAWYKVRLRVTDDHVQVWINGKSTVRVPREHYQFGRKGQEPFALAAWETGVAYRSIVLTRLDAK